MSTTFTVKVHTKVTSRIVDAILTRGQTLVVRGGTTPAKPGVTATLWRKTSAGPVKLDTATVDTNGTYKLTEVASTRGTWKVYVTVPAATGNLAGESPLRSAGVN
jgi:hypothetical protein